MTANKKTSLLLDSFTAYLRESHKRITPERLSILEVIASQPGIFTVDDLHQRMITQAFPVTVATVYNTVQLLIEADLLRCVRLPDDNTARYRLSQGDTGHVMLVCSRCGAVKETHPKNLIRFINKFDFPTFSPQAFSLSVYGLCSKCRKIQKSTNNKPNKIQREK